MTTLPPDTMLGPYRVVGPIGAGGMGVVYRATDTRLGREVAVKVLAPAYARDPDALRRFEAEARAAGMLNHPNILAIYDVGSSDSVHYIVSELLEGESLRGRIRQGPVPPRKAIDIATQIARGLAAAHEKSIVHRDLKPENVFLTRDGQVKILDFGLAKLMERRVTGAASTDTEVATLKGTPTEPGRIIGTVGYMAPEQVRGEPGDQRSDIFSFGVILYEMLTGQPPFEADTPIETLNAILNGDISDSWRDLRLPAALERIVEHCLEKNPNERFQSARDLAFNLGAMSGLTSPAVQLPPPRLKFRRIAVPLLLSVGVVAALIAAFYAGRTTHRPPSMAFRRVTFRNGTVFGGRFSPDGSTVFYGARFAGNPIAVYSARTDSPESRELGFGAADVLAVSSTGQLAISLARHPIGYLRESGTLAQVPIAGGAPRPLLDDVEEADFTPDGTALAIVRTIRGRCRIEYPIGNVLYDTVGWISSVRFSPDGTMVAFVDHPLINDDRGTVTVLDLRDRTRRVLSSEFDEVHGAVWRPDGREIWFAATRTGMSRAIRAVDLRGHERLVVAAAGALSLLDISRKGAALVARETLRAGIIARVPGDPRDRDLSWLDFSVVRDLSADGKTILFSESGEGGGSIFGVYIRSIDGSPAVHLGDGTSEALSPDGRWVLSIPRSRTPAPIVALPTGTGQAQALAADRLEHRAARWLPDGRGIVFIANEPGRDPRTWVQPLGGAPRAITPEKVLGLVVSPDGRRVIARGPDRRYFAYPTDGGRTATPLPFLTGGDVPVRFSGDGRSLFVATFGHIPALLYRVDVVTGGRTEWFRAMPADPAGLTNVGPVLVTPDGATAVYSFTRLLSDLYVLTER